MRRRWRGWLGVGWRGGFEEGDLWYFDIGISILACRVSLA